MNIKNITTLTLLGMVYLGLAMLVVQVHPGIIVSGFALPGVTTEALKEIR